MKVIHGYCTEKIMDAFKTKTIPIYYGDKNIESEFYLFTVNYYGSYYLYLI